MGFKRVWVLLFGFTCWLSPQAWSAEDCRSLHLIYDTIAQVKANGQYRFAASPDLLQFSFAPEQPFSAYLAYAESRIKQGNPKASLPCAIDTPLASLLVTPPKTVGQLIAPFEIRPKGAKQAVLLIHGLTDTPYQYHELAAYFYQLGYGVRTLLLPGHGTAPSDLIESDEAEWRRATRYAIERMQEDYEQIYLGGYSTGAALILNELLERTASQQGVKGIFLWAPASRAVSPYIGLSGYVDRIPYLDWLGKEADIDFAKYESFPLNAATQVYRLMERLNEKLEKGSFPAIPRLTVVSQEDTTIDSEKTLEWVARWQSQGHPQTLIYYGDPDVVGQVLSKEQGLRIIVPSCQSGVCRHVGQMGHLSLLSSPRNPHYGFNGVNRSCNHYQRDSQLHRLCKTSPDYRWGETTQELLSDQSVPLRRLTFNPYYGEMLDTIDEFMASTSSSH